MQIESFRFGHLFGTQLGTQGGVDTDICDTNCTATRSQIIICDSIQPLVEKQNVRPCGGLKSGITKNYKKRDTNFVKSIFYTLSVEFSHVTKLHQSELLFN
uniref:Uncharacterized protein n=1 Tax=Strigamia maritima TaxID=126957 RepID=T1JF26_STRMM